MRLAAASPPPSLLSNVSFVQAKAAKQQLLATIHGKVTLMVCILR